MTVPFKPGAPVDRRALQAERDVARADRRAALAEQALAAASGRLDRLAREKAEGASRADALQAQIETLHASTSWRISRPVRLASALLRRLRREPAPVPSPPRAAGALPAPELGPLSRRDAAILQRLQGRAAG